jgi:hypothetical protein
MWKDGPGIGMVSLKKDESAMAMKVSAAWNLLVCAYLGLNGHFRRATKSQLEINYSHSTLFQEYLRQHRNLMLLVSTPRINTLSGWSLRRGAPITH